MNVTQPMYQKPGLVADGGDDSGVSMSHGRDAKPGGQIEIAIAIHVEDIGPQRLLPDNGGAVGSHRVDTRGLVAGRPAGQPTRSGTRGWAENAGEQIATPKLCHGLDLSSTGKRSREGDLVGIFDIPTHRHAERQTRDPDLVLFEESSQVEGCGLSLHVRVGGQDDLFKPVETLEKPSHPDLVGADSSLWRQRSHEDVIPTMELARSFYGLDVVGLLHYTDLCGIALWVGAKGTGLDVRDGVADRAVKELVFDLEHRRGQDLGISTGDLQQMVS